MPALLLSAAALRFFRPESWPDGPGVTVCTPGGVHMVMQANGILAGLGTVTKQSRAGRSFPVVLMSWPQPLMPRLQLLTWAGVLP